MDEKIWRGYTLAGHPPLNSIPKTIPSLLKKKNKKKWGDTPGGLGGYKGWVGDKHLPMP